MVKLLTVLRDNKKIANLLTLHKPRLVNAIHLERCIFSELKPGTRNLGIFLETVVHRGKLSRSRLDQATSIFQRKLCPFF